MTQQFMDAIRFRGMVGRRTVPNILSALEHSIRQTGQKVPSGQKTSGRSKCESGSPSQKVRNIFQLWNVVCCIANFILEKSESINVLLASMAFEKRD
jgi:hypothetical protein